MEDDDYSAATYQQNIMLQKTHNPKISENAIMSAPIIQRLRDDANLWMSCEAGRDNEVAGLLSFEAAETIEALCEALQSINDLEYYINNPSAWESFDNTISEKLRTVVIQARDALAKAQS
jgi:hypothetical protein